MTFSRAWVRCYRGSKNWILDGLIMVLLGGMVLLAAAQIALRNLFSYSLFWGDDVLQLALLWLVMAGAVAAARSGEHLRINVLMQFFPRASRPWLYSMLHGFTATVCAILCWQSVRMAQDAWLYGDRLIGDLPAWLAQSVMPVGFGVLAIHYGVRCLSEMFHGLARRRPRGGIS